MNLSVMEAMTTEALVAIRDQAAHILQARSRSGLRVGAIAHFNDRNGIRRTMKIQRVNAKTVTGVETGANGVTMRWRVSPQFLTVDGTDVKPAFISASKHVPSTASSATW